MTTICEYNDKVGSISVEGPNKFGDFLRFNLVAHNIGQKPDLLMTATFKLALREFDRLVKRRAQDNAERLNASISIKTGRLNALPLHQGE